MERTEGHPERAVRRSWVVAAIFLVIAAALVWAARCRAAETRHIRRVGMRLNAVVLSSSRGVFVHHVAVRYDVDDGRVLTRSVPVAGPIGVTTGDSVRLAYDVRQPGRARILGTRDPGPMIDGVVAAIELVIAASIIAAALRFRGGAASAKSKRGTAIAVALLAPGLAGVALGLDRPFNRLSQRFRAEPVAACRIVDRAFDEDSSRVDRDPPEAVDQTTILRLPRLLMSSPPPGTGFERSPVTTDSFLTLDQAAALRRDHAEGVRTLSRFGYVGGYRRDWTRGDRFLTAFVYEFSSPRNAAAFDAYANRYVCPFDAEAFRSATVPGALGHRIGASGGRELRQVSFVRGARRFLVGISAGPVSPASTDIEAAAAQASRSAGR